MTARTKMRIGDCCEITSSKRVHAADYVESGVPFYRGKEIIEKHRGGLSVSTELFISEQHFEGIRTKFGAPSAGDLLLTSVGTLGVPYVVEAGERFYFKDGNLTWFKNFNGLDSRYLAYWFVSDQGKAELRKCTIGSSQPALTIVLLKEMQIDLPPLAVQRQIADTLSAYDDLIENNTRRIAILEEMAQRLYREWFVHFRYPGHESVPLVESELGQIPKGWNVAPLSSIANLSTIQTNPAKFGEEVVQHFSLPAFDESRLPVIERGDEIKSNKFLVEQSCVLLAKLNPKIPRCWLVYLNETRPALASTEFLVLTPQRDVPLEYLFLAVTSDTFWLRLENMALGTSTSHQRVKPADAMASLLVLPPVDVIQQFENRCAPLLQLRSTLTAQTKLLRELQSLLLPRMIF